MKNVICLLAAAVVVFPGRGLAAPASPAPQTQIPWVSNQGGNPPVMSAEAKTFVKYGASVTLFIDCIDGVVGVSAGYFDDATTMPEPRRTAVSNYMRALYIRLPTLVVIEGQQMTTVISWDSAEGGFGKVSPSTMSKLLSAESLELRGGREVIKFSTSNIRAATNGVIRQCRMRLPAGR
ncbi:MAG TPA: hypothetical protein VFW47_09400 [Phenylobacterium sp.]|nr:hypothetical protein [Phenylobacterium sp.]